MTSLDTSFDPGPGASSITFQGASVLNLFCADAVADQTPVPCGEQDGDAWRVQGDIPQGGYRVMALLGLPAAQTAAG
jgi:hypothetical protein